MDTAQARQRIDALRTKVINGGSLSTAERTFVGNLLDAYGSGLTNLAALGGGGYVGPYGSGGGGPYS